jgi:hypothetical protein
MSDDLTHDNRMARLQRVIDRLEQVTKQARDLARMAAELQQEAGESIRLVKTERTKARRPKRRRTRTARGN